MGSSEDEEAAAVVAARRGAEVDVGVEDHAGERVVDAVGEGLVLGAVLDPEGVEVDVLGEGAEQREDVDDLGGVGGSSVSSTMGVRSGGGVR